MKRINSSWRTLMTFVISERLAVQRKGMTVRSSCWAILLLSNDLSMIFEPEQEAFVPPAIARFRSDLNAFPDTICPM